MATFGAGLMRCMCVSLWLAALPLGSVADAADFYKGRTITFVIGSAPAGATTPIVVWSPAISGDTFEGRPTIVPQNMPGAGSIRAANYLYNVAPKDGTMIGMVDEAIFLNQILGAQEPTTDASKLNWVGAILRRSRERTRRRRTRSNSIGSDAVREQRHTVRAKRRRCARSTTSSTRN